MKVNLPDIEIESIRIHPLSFVQFPYNWSNITIYLGSGTLCHLYITASFFVHDYGILVKFESDRINGMLSFSSLILTESYAHI